MPDRNKKKKAGGTARNKTGPVRAKKFLGQHFLRDEEIASRIADTLSLEGYRDVLEIGPGTGMLTKYLLKKELRLTVLEIDRESLAYLRGDFMEAHTLPLENKENFRILQADVLRVDFQEIYGETPFAIIGNFPYNISTQIVFRMLEMRRQVPEFAGMFQKEVARRICEKEGSKTYGILSVLVQAFYDASYLFTVPPEVFDPPPKVESGVLLLRRRKEQHLSCDESLFFRVVKTAFNQRRKTLRNSLKSFLLSDNLKEDTIFDLRPEQLSVDHFIALSKKIEHDTV